MNILEDVNFSLLEGFSKSAEAEYKNYVKDHIKNVQKAYKFIKENVPQLLDELEIPLEEMDEQIKRHDESKWSKEEFGPYADHWYGKIDENGKRCERDEESKEYNDAWVHHYSTNPHHEEYWKKKDIPYSCLLEMLCDWLAFSFKKGDLSETKNFWENKKEEKSKILSKKSFNKIDEMINTFTNATKKYSNTSLEKLTEAFERNSKKKLFHLSKHGDIKEMTPSIPKTVGDEEDKVTKRICFAPTIQGCLIGINENKDIVGEEYYVYSYTTDDYIIPTTKQVPERDITDEHWITKKCKPVLECKIKITNVKEYKDVKIDVNDFKCPVWEYKIIKKFNSEVLTESIKMTKGEFWSVFKEAEKLIKKCNKILIVRHISPDADAVCGAQAMQMAIKQKYPKKEVILGTEKTREELSSNDLLIILDLGIKERIAAEILGNPHTIRFDHHQTGMVSEVMLELPEAGSTCELITLFLDDQKYPINKKMAEMLFRGIITDTGRMQYSLSDTTLSAISILKDVGIDYKKVYNQMYVKDDISLKSKAYILANYKTTPNGVAYLFLDHERCAKAGIDMNKTSQQVYEMGEIKGCPIWVIISEKDRNNLTMRVRSRVIPIKKVAEKFGGGGHENACGIKVSNRNEVKDVLRELDNELRKYKGQFGNLLEGISVRKEYDGKTLEVVLDADVDLNDGKEHTIKSKNALLKLKKNGSELDLIVDIETDIKEENDNNIDKFNKKLKEDMKRAKASGVPTNIPEVLYNALSELSEKQIGALLAFENQQNLDKYCENGTKMDCPISEEIFMSIFYPGTEVHDGATIIKDGIIKYSSVFFKNISGDSFAEHYGARHRAAMGLSKTTDGFCIVVSEESGNISFAVDGKLEIIEAAKVKSSKNKFIELYNKNSKKKINESLSKLAKIIKNK